MGNSINREMKKLRLNIVEIVDQKNVTPYHEKVALIVEPREHVNLVPIIAQMASLYPDWFILLYHGNQNELYVTNDPTLSELRRTGKLALFHLNVDNVDATTYDAMFTTVEFWNTVNATYAFVFQTDAWICNNPDFDLNQFVKYDYIGSPQMCFPGYGMLNGGVSLRNVNAMKNMIQTCPYNPYTTIPLVYKAEDRFFSNPCKRMKSPYKVASFEEAKSFSVQTKMFYDPAITPVAVHKPWLAWCGLTSNQMVQLETQCPGVKLMTENYNKRN